MAQRRRFRVFRRSGFEDKIEQQLKEAKVKYEYESTKIEYRTPISSGECVSCGHRKVFQRCTYTPDFTLASGVIIECKGYLDRSDRAKLGRIRKQHPELDLRIVFQRDNTCKDLKEKPRYSKWAEKAGFKWALKEVPKDWLQ